MLLFGLGLGLLIALAGALTYYLAPRVGPNPIFGVRVGYSFASREVWDRTNRAGGALIALTGVALGVAALFFQLLNVAPSTGVPVLTVALIVALLAETAWLFFYARGLARETNIAREIAPVKFRWAYLAPVLVSFAMLVALAAYWYPQLPAERIATHFNFNDQPDDWMPRDTFLASFLGIAALMAAFNSLIVLVATREPLIAFGRWGARWRMEPAQGLLYVGWAMALTNGVLMIALVAIGWYNTRGAHLFPLSLFFWLLIPFVGALILLFFALARRAARTA